MLLKISTVFCTDRCSVIIGVNLGKILRAVNHCIGINRWIPYGRGSLPLPPRESGFRPRKTFEI